MRLGSIAAMGDFWKVVREFNPEGIEREATAPLDLWLLGEPESGRHTVAKSLLGDDARAEVGRLFTLFDLGERQDPIPLGERPDLLVVVVRLDRPLSEVGKQASAIINRMRAPAVLVFTHADAIDITRDLRNAAYRTFSFVSFMRTVFVDARDQAEVQAKLIPVILDASPSVRTPLARRIPAARLAVAEQIIGETSRVNAQFALMANLPANLPLVGGLAGSVADFFVLTKNQVMMALRLAAIYGRDVSLTRKSIAEIAPVIGNGVLWRSAARMTVGMLPTVVAAAPKAAIAYVGTYVAGQAARYYYDEGRKPPQELLKRFSSEGTSLYRRALARGVSSNTTALS
jgi:uncharacterized protein (DUF697 family)